jgi:hypothetical protein
MVTFCAFIVFFLVSCKNGADSTKKEIVDSDLYDAYINFGSSIKQKRNVLVFDGGGAADNCNAYLELSSEVEILESINNQIIKSEYLICDALHILSNSETYTRNVDRNKIGEALLMKLDLRSFPNSFSIMTEDNSYTLSHIFPDQSLSIGSSVLYESSDWLFHLRVVAVVNINNNSNPDWIIQLSDESKLGNYRNYSTLVIYDTESSEVLKAMKYH